MDQQKNKLKVPPEEIIDSLSREDGVATRDVVLFLTSLEGLTEDEGIATLNDLTFRKSWNRATHLAAAEGLDYAKSDAFDRSG